MIFQFYLRLFEILRLSLIWSFYVTLNCLNLLWRNGSTNNVLARLNMEELWLRHKICHNYCLLFFLLFFLPCRCGIFSYKNQEIAMNQEL